MVLPLPCMQMEGKNRGGLGMRLVYTSENLNIFIKACSYSKYVPKYWCDLALYKQHLPPDKFGRSCSQNKTHNYHIDTH